MVDEQAIGPSHNIAGPIEKEHIDYHIMMTSCFDEGTLPELLVNLRLHSMQQLLLSPPPHLPP